VIGVDTSRLLVQFGERELWLAPEEIDQIVPAYGITVHRAQGSEYPAVVLPLDKAHSLMLRRRLLYTAVTRAKQRLVVVGSRWALERAIANDDEGRRFTGLRERLEEGMRGDGVHPEDYLG
jgi:exodeoxyribonuclease V alpha subunit